MNSLTIHITEYINSPGRFDIYTVYWIDGELDYCDRTDDYGPLSEIIGKYVLHHTMKGASVRTERVELETYLYGYTLHVDGVA